MISVMLLIMLWLYIVAFGTLITKNNNTIIYCYKIGNELNQKTKIKSKSILFILPKEKVCYINKDNNWIDISN